MEGEQKSGAGETPQGDLGQSPGDKQGQFVVPADVLQQAGLPNTPEGQATFNREVWPEILRNAAFGHKVALKLQEQVGEGSPEQNAGEEKEPPAQKKPQAVKKPEEPSPEDLTERELTRIAVSKRLKAKYGENAGSIDLVLDTMDKLADSLPKVIDKVAGEKLDQKIRENYEGQRRREAFLTDPRNADIMKREGGREMLIELISESGWSEQAAASFVRKHLGNFKEAEPVETHWEGGRSEGVFVDKKTESLRKRLDDLEKKPAGEGSKGKTNSDELFKMIAEGMFS